MVRIGKKLTEIRRVLPHIHKSIRQGILVHGLNRAAIQARLWTELLDIARTVRLPDYPPHGCDRWLPSGIVLGNRTTREVAKLPLGIAAGIAGCDRLAGAISDLADGRAKGDV